MKEQQKISIRFFDDREVRGGMGLHLAIGIGMGAIFIFLSKFSATFATNRSMPPVLGVWIPNLLFSGIAY